MIHAIYDRGILTISVPLGDDEPAAKHIEITETVLLDEDDDDEDDEDDEDDDEEDTDEIEAEEADDQSEPSKASVPS